MTGIPVLLLTPIILDGFTIFMWYQIAAETEGINLLDAVATVTVGTS